jgi:hypothetical protein
MQTNATIAIIATAYLALASWATAIWARRLRDWRWTRWAWSLGSLANLCHLLLAFHYLHNWDHTAAYAAIAQQTYEQVGWEWGGGIFINYAFSAMWLVDAVIWWLRPRHYLTRPRWMDGVVQFIFLFMFFNATVVFGKSTIRVWGGVLCLVAATGWILISWRHTTKHVAIASETNDTPTPKRIS